MATEDDKGNHPAYQHILDKLPDSLVSIITPELKKWDAGVTQKFQEIHAQYEPLKQFQRFIDNEIDADYAEKAVVLADQLQREPAKVVAEINESWSLGFVTPEEAANLQKNTNTDPEDEFGLGDGDSETKFDVMKDPRVKAMADALEKVQKGIDEQHQQTQEEAEIQAFENELDTLEASTKEADKPFNRMFVTAMMQQGLSSEDALKQYHLVLAGNVDTQEVSEQVDSTKTDAPVVMGGSGATGSGTPDGSVDFGKLSKNDLNGTIEQILAQAQTSGQ